MKHIVSLILAASLCCSCEKVVIDDDVAGDETAVNISFSPITTDGFYATRSNNKEELANVATRLSVTAFNTSGDKSSSITQTLDRHGDEFGTVTLYLSPGTYSLVAVAHNSTYGNCTITSENKVTFSSNKASDTFYYYGELKVNDATEDDNTDENTETDGTTNDRDITMERCVAMVRFVFDDEELPSQVAQMKFYYTGGSSTFSPSTGFGVVNSKQTEYREISDDDERTFEIFTFPHSTTGEKLKIVATALDASGNTLQERTFDDVPITLRRITQLRGVFFDDHSSGDNKGFSINVSAEWEGVDEYTF